MSDIGSFYPFRTYAATESSISVANELTTDFVPYMLIRRERYLWYVHEVSEELIQRIKTAGTKDLREALDLHEHDAIPAERLIRTNSPVNMIEGKGVHVVLDTRGTPRALHFGLLPVRGLFPPMEGTLFSRVMPRNGYEVNQDEIIEFDVDIQPTPMAGVSAGLHVNFPEGTETLDLYAVVSAQDFAPPAGESWIQHFSVNRQLQCSPANWSFKSRAIGNRNTYSLKIIFQAAGVPVGTLIISLRRRGQPIARTPIDFESSEMCLPTEHGARLQIVIAEQGSANAYELNLFEDGVQWDDPQPWTDVNSDTYFKTLNTAKGTQKLAELGLALWTDLPRRVREFLDRVGVAGWSTPFTSDKRVAPFEVLRMSPDKQMAHFLGIDRPVTRWDINTTACAKAELQVDKVACIRPEYEQSVAVVPSRVEEEDMRRRFPNLLPVVRRKADLETLLDRSDVSIIHFAGHADAAFLVLEDDPQVPPHRFDPFRPLLKNNLPFA